MSLLSSGQCEASKIIKDVTLTSPTRASKYMTAYTSRVGRTLTDNKALSVLVKHKFSKRTYQEIRKVDRENHCKLYSSYNNNVLKAKKRCYPLRTSITITEISAEVKLQAFIDHTINRILFLQKEVIGTLTVDNVKNMYLICK